MCARVFLSAVIVLVLNMSSHNHFSGGAQNGHILYGYQSAQLCVHEFGHLWRDQTNIINNELKGEEDAAS